LNNTPKAKESGQRYQESEGWAEDKKEGGCPKSTHDCEGNHLTLPKIWIKYIIPVVAGNHALFGILKDFAA